MNTTFIEITFSWFWLLLALALILCLIIFIEWKWCRERPQLIFQSTRSNHTLLDRCPSLFSDYCFPFWGRNSHLQTLFVSLLRRAPKPNYSRETLHALDDNGLIVLDWLYGTSGSTINDITEESFSSTINNGRSLIVLIVPGLCNSSDSHYIRHFSKRCQEKGWTAVIFHPRGAEDLSTPSLFTYGGTSDLHQAVEHIHKRYPNVLLAAIGFSMGANILLKYMGENSIPPKVLCGVISVSQGYDGYRGIQILKKKSFYHKVITAKLKRLLKRHEYIFRKTLNVEEIMRKVKSVEAFDEYVTCKVYGFRNSESYYKEHSCIHHLHKLQVPTLLLNALDDPLIPSDLIPVDLPLQIANVILAITKHGGHLGWSQGSLIPLTHHWHETVAIEFLESLFLLNTENSQS